MVEKKAVTGPEIKSHYLSVGELSQRSGISISALHFYEKKGLIQSYRSEGNQRRYVRATLRRLSLIRVAQNVGLPLAEIKQALKLLPPKAAPSKKHWQKLSACWHDNLSQRIQVLQALKDNLQSCIGCGCLSLEECSLSNANDKLAKVGAGPHLLLMASKSLDFKK